LVQVLQPYRRRGELRILLHRGSHIVSQFAARLLLEKFDPDMLLLRRCDVTAPAALSAQAELFMKHPRGRALCDDHGAKHGWYERSSTPRRVSASILYLGKCQ
jgi:hypothetical protein